MLTNICKELRLIKTLSYCILLCLRLVHWTLPGTHLRILSESFDQNYVPDQAKNIYRLFSNFKKCVSQLSVAYHINLLASQKTIVPRNGLKLYL